MEQWERDYIDAVSESKKEIWTSSSKISSESETPIKRKGFFLSQSSRIRAKQLLYISEVISVDTLNRF